MRSFKRWLDRSLAAQAVMIFLLGVGVSALFRRGDHPVLWVIQGFFYATIGVTCVAVQRRRASRAAGTDPHGLAELSRRIRHREVPSEPGERASMRRLVDDQLSLLEHNRRWLPYWLGLMGLITAALLALGVATGSLAFPLVFAVAVIGLCCWVVWMRRRASDRFQYMQAALREDHERVS
jgi:Flp pilus assembly protein TadB